MTLIQYVYLYLLTIPIFALFDIAWLGFIARDFYQDRLAHLLGPVHWPAAIIFYLIFIAGILIFAVAPALDSNSLSKAIVLGVLFGFFTYATYDLTNLATLKDWPVLVVIVDIMWGAFISGSVATISYLIGKALFL
ncbi:MAG: DUF2177 family protein [Candidatus Paceibacterota bacterium]